MNGENKQPQQPPTPPMTQPSADPQLQQLLQQLTTACTTLTLKVATIECNHKDTCGVYQRAKEIASVIDKLQERAPRG